MLFSRNVFDMMRSSFHSIISLLENSSLVDGMPDLWLVFDKLASVAYIAGRLLIKCIVGSGTILIKKVELLRLDAKLFLDIKTKQLNQYNFSLYLFFIKSQ
jgi:hypothetical protein